MHATRRILLVPALLLAACSDPQGPCDVGDACRFEGPHLVADVRLAGNPAPVGGLPAVSPGEVAFSLEVSNQGDTTTAAARVTVGIIGPGLEDALYSYELPPMLPGDVRRGTITLDLDAPFLAGTDVRHAWLRIESLQDPAVELATAMSGDFRLLLPVLSLELTGVPDTVRFGSPARVTVRVQNLSQHVALAAAPLKLRLENTTWDDVFPDWPTIALPAIAPGQTYLQEHTVAVPADAGFWMDGYNHLNGGIAQQIYDTYQTYRLRACVGAENPLCVQSSEEVRGALDLEACAGGTATVGQAVPVTIACTDTYAGPVAVWRFHAEAGDMFQFQVTNAGGPGVTRILKRDGTMVASHNSMNPGAVLQQAGDYYLTFWSVQYPVTQPTLTTQRPAPAGAIR